MDEKEPISPQQEEEKQESLLSRELPADFTGELSADWSINPSLEPNRQIVRAINKAEDYLAGIVPDGTDKNRARLEAGRMLVYLRSITDDGDLVSEEQRAYLQQEIDRVWNQGGGREANQSWVESHPQKESATRPESAERASNPETLSPAERILGSLEQRINGIAQIYDSSIKAIDQAISFISTNDPGNSRISGLELCKKILTRKINPQENTAALLVTVEQAREAFRNGSLNDKESENQLLSKVRSSYGRIAGAFIEVANSLQRTARNTEAGPSRSVIEAAQRDMEDLLRVVGGIEKIVAAQGQKVDFEKMEPVDVVETQDPAHSAGDTIAEVSEDGYQFNSDLSLFGGKGADVIQRPKVEVYKSSSK